jgi:hypothetical protein
VVVTQLARPTMVALSVGMRFSIYRYRKRESLRIPPKPHLSHHLSSKSKRDRAICRRSGVRFCGTYSAPSISRAARTIAMTSFGRSSIIADVKRSTHQPSRIKRFCRQRSVSNTSEPLW